MIDRHGRLLHRRAALHRPERRKRTNGARGIPWS